LNSLVIGLAIVIGPIIGTLLINRQLNNQRRQLAVEKVEDRKREDAIRKEENEQKEAVAEEALRQQKEVANTAERAAQLLAESNKANVRRTDEVAKQLAGEATAVAQAYGIPVVISYVETGQREDVLLSNVPRIGERVRLRNGAGAPSVIVEDVVWMEAFLPPPNPSVIIVVRGQTKSEEKEQAEIRRLRR